MRDIHEHTISFQIVLNSLNLNDAERNDNQGVSIEEESLRSGTEKHIDFEKKKRLQDIHYQRQVDEQERFLLHIVNFNAIKDYIHN